MHSFKVCQKYIPEEDSGRLAVLFLSQAFVAGGSEQEVRVILVITVGVVDARAQLPLTRVPVSLKDSVVK